VTRTLSYHIAEQMREGSLETLLRAHDDQPLPLHVIAPQGRLSMPKVRAFIDLAVPRRRSHFAPVSRGTE
jgi:hypothetical protein